MINDARSAHTFLVVILCLVFVASCVPDDSAFSAIKQAIDNADKDPASSYRALETNLGKVQDKAVIPLLLNYFEETKQQERSYPSLLGLISLYFEDISEIKGHVSVTIAGPVYSRDEGWEEDVAKWRAWRDANRDFIDWDKQTQSLKVKPH